MASVASIRVIEESLWQLAKYEKAWSSLNRAIDFPFDFRFSLKIDFSLKKGFMSKFFTIRLAHRVSRILEDLVYTVMQFRSTD